MNFKINANQAVQRWTSDTQWTRVELQASSKKLDFGAVMLQNTLMTF